MPRIDSSVIFGYWQSPKENAFEKVQLIWNSEENGLPANNQAGPTCGIYALHAAANVLGKHYAKPPTKKGAQVKSIRAKAKKRGLSQIGEINGAGDLQMLATSIGIPAKILTFGDADELWAKIVASADAGHAIVFPYTAANDAGEVGGMKGQDGFTHWALLCGYAFENEASRFVFMTTYGQYHMDDVDDLYKSNLAIQDWSAQRWGKINLWTIEPPDGWKLWQTTWMAELGARATLEKMIQDAKGERMGLAVGTKEKPLYILCHPGPMGDIINPNNSVGVFIFTGSVDFHDMPYKANMVGKCVVVTK